MQKGFIDPAPGIGFTGLSHQLNLDFKETGFVLGRLK